MKIEWKQSTYLQEWAEKQEVDPFAGEVWVGFHDWEELKASIEGPSDECPPGQTFEEFQAWIHEMANRE